MKRKTVQKICNIVSAGLVAAFIIKTVINYFQYDVLSNSAPFSAWILINAVFLIVPALVIFLIGQIIGRHR